MNPAELALVKVALHEVVDQLLPQLIAAEEAKLPAPYQALVMAVSGAIMPELIKAIDAKIDALA